ncbi:MAG: class I SAM-dependent methyltransferase [Phycisphaerales bacterium]|nr:MAG: class I SAM-dependent methyltransferase [Phycisphaerales bacterium]
MRQEKQVVRDFYDTYGWEKEADGKYKDTSAFVDLRPVLDDYAQRTHRRVLQSLPRHGECLLDAGSGAIAHAEYLEYSARYKWRLCVDLSAKALTEARTKLGDKGICVLADLTELPFADNTFDATVSAHTLYHVPYDEQEAAVWELYRTLAPGKTCVIVYAWPNDWFQRARQCYRRFLQLIAKIPGARRLKIMILGEYKPPRGGRADPAASSRPPLYYQPHDYRWFQNTFAASLNMEIRAWRSVDRSFTEACVPNNRAGRLIMRIVFWCEEVFPHLLGRLGRYALIIIRK